MKSIFFYHRYNDLNQTTVFVTNSKEAYGSSLYLICDQGTIRCTSSNQKGRQPTTYIRPYLIGYLKEHKKREEEVIYGTIEKGLRPYEGPVKTLDELRELRKNKRRGHKGHFITEILSFEALQNQNYQPLTWQESDNNGVTWEVARTEVLEALKYVSSRNYSFESKEHLVYGDTKLFNKIAPLPLKHEKDFIDITENQVKSLN